MTGRPPTVVSQNAPENVEFTGYLSNGDYELLLKKSDVVLALTTRDLTMQRAGYEALREGKPHVTSSFETLKRFYGDSAVYANPHDARSISDGVNDAIVRKYELSERIRETAARRLQEQDTQIEWLRTYVGATKNAQSRMRQALVEGA